MILDYGKNPTHHVVAIDRHSINVIVHLVILIDNVMEIVLVELLVPIVGIPQHLLRTILIYATETQIEVNTLATVCKRFNTILDNGSDCNEFRIRHDWYKKSTIGLRMIRKFQKQSPRNEIIEVICGRQLDKSIDDVESMADNEKFTVLRPRVIIFFRLIEGLF